MIWPEGLQFAFALQLWLHWLVLQVCCIEVICVVMLRRLKFWTIWPISFQPMLFLLSRKAMLGRRVNITTNVNERIVIFRSAGCDGKFETTDDVVAESQKSGDSSFLVRVSWHFWLESYDVIDGEIVTDE